MNDGTPPAIGPRVEAHVRPYEHLTPSQQRAVDQIRSFICAPEGADERREPEWRLAGAIPALNSTRSSRVLLIDGARGSGKTCVLLHLYDEWREQLRLAAPKDRAGALVVPLPILDLQPLPETSDLPAVLVSVFRGLHNELLRGDEPSSRAAHSAAWMTEMAAGPEPELARRWHDLRRSVVAWSGKVGSGREDDARVVSRDLEDASSAITNFPLVFRRYVDALVGAYRKELAPHRTAPIFVLLIDDADMNPARSGELIDLFRTLYHSRLVFLMTGDSDLFRIALRNRMLGALTNQPGHVLRDSERGPNHEYATDLARSIYDRTIPPHQRLKLPPLSPNERWPGTLRGDVRKANEWALALYDELNSLSAPALELGREDAAPAQEDVDDAAPRSSPGLVRGRLPTDKGLRDYFDPPAPGEPPRLTFSLPNRMRTLQDLVLRIRAEREARRASTRVEGADAREAKPDLDWHVVVHWLWTDAIERSLSHPEDRLNIEGVVALEDAAPYRDVLRILATDQLVWNVRHRTVRSTPTPRGTLVTQDVGRLELQLKTDDKLLRLAPQIRDAFRLAVDVAAVRGEQAFIGALTLPRIELLVSHLRLEGVPTLKVPWPLPRWIRFLPFDRFTAAWRRLTGPNELSLHHLLRAFFGAVFQADQVEARLEEQTGGSPRSWDELNVIFHRYRDAASSPGAPTALATWSRVASLVLAPEYGLSDTEAERAFETLWGPAPLLPSDGQRLKDARASALDEILAQLDPEQRSSARDAILALGRGSNEVHPWYRYVEVIELPAPETLADAWAEIAVPHPEHSFSSTTPSFLAGYLETDRRRVLVDQIGREHENMTAIVAAVRAREEDGADMAKSSVQRLFDFVRRSQTGRAASSPIESVELELDRDLKEPRRTIEADAGVSLRLRSRSRWIEQGSRTRDSALLELARRVAVDVAFDLGLSVGGSTQLGPPAWWDGVEIVHQVKPARGKAKQVVLAWPAPAYRAPFDLELLDQLWNNLVDQVLAASHSERKNRIPDSLAHAYVLRVGWLARSRRVTGGLDFQVLATKHAESLFKKAALEILKTHRTEHGLRSQRWVAFDDWRWRVPLLAAPEYGLSTEAARGLLEGMTEAIELDAEPPKVPFEQRLAFRVAALSELRSKRWKEGGGAKRTLETPADHPWTKHIGRPSKQE